MIFVIVDPSHLLAAVVPVKKSMSKGFSIHSYQALLQSVSVHMAMWKRFLTIITQRFFSWSFFCSSSSLACFLIKTEKILLRKENCRTLQYQQIQATGHTYFCSSMLRDLALYSSSLFSASLAYGLQQFIAKVDQILIEWLIYVFKTNTKLHFLS